MDRIKIDSRFAGLGFLMGMVLAVPTNVARDSSYAGNCRDSSQVCSYSDSLVPGNMKECTTKKSYDKGKCTDPYMDSHCNNCVGFSNCTHNLEGFTVDSLPKYLPKDTSKNVCLPGDKTCD